MKTNKFNRKLTLNKKTVANLTTLDMEALRGGLGPFARGTVPPMDTCVLSMVICTYTIPRTYTLCGTVCP